MAYKTLYTINIGSFSMSLIRSHERFIACWNTSQKVTAWRVEITYKEVRLQHVVAKCTVCKKIPKELNTARHRQQVNPRKEWTHAWNHVHLPRLRTHAILGWNAAPGSRLWPEQGERFPASLWGRDLSGGGDQCRWTPSSQVLLVSSPGGDDSRFMQHRCSLVMQTVPECCWKSQAGVIYPLTEQIHKQKMFHWVDFLSMWKL